MKRQTKKAIKKSLVLLALVTITLIVISITVHDQKDDDFIIDRSIVSHKVLAYEPLIKKYAQVYNVTDYTDVLMAMMMQESGGRGGDPMQASESYCGKIGCIQQPEQSIKQGVLYFSRTLAAADGDLLLAIQSYNFGRGFIAYAKNKSGAYSQETAIAFSKMMYHAAPDKSIYTCLRKEAKKYDACYGDIYYVRDVLQYKQALTSKRSG